MKVVSRLAVSLLLASAAALAAIWISGCQSQHPDDKAAVYAILGQHDLASVEVLQDRGKGVITLKGIVGSQANKQSAEQLTKQAAPGYQVQDQLTVNSTGIMSMANPNAKAPVVEEMAHPPTDSSPSSATSAKR